jgi:hypothetical protein
MATVACPSGHQSATTDYCDQCGAKIEDPGNVTVPPIAASPALCPSCESPRGDGKFCEVCGYDFALGTLPAAPAVVAAPPVAGAGAVAASSPASGGAAAVGAPWQAVVSADREYYDRNEIDDIPFPEHCPERLFSLTQDEILIGRRSESRGTRPQLDLTGAPEDTGISHSHAILRRAADGGYVVIDPGSTNGTILNDSLEPIASNVATPLKDGDRLYIGAWTRIVFHAPPP